MSEVIIQQQLGKFMQKKTANLFLIGPMGSGKTTIGQHLAQKLKLTFHDADHEIERRAGVDIPWIFAKEGEAAFRKCEADVIAALTQLDNIVLATGGGVVLSSSNRTALKMRGTVIYLQVTLEQQLARLALSHERPLLSNANPREVLTTLQKTREPLYREIADYIIDTDHLDADQVTQAILDLITANKAY